MFCSDLSVQNSVLIGTGVLFGIVILLLVAFDMKAKMRGINSHRDEQSTMSDLYEKYKSASEAGTAVRSGVKASGGKTAGLSKGKMRKAT